MKKSRAYRFAFAAFLFFPLSAYCQYGTAPNGYYPRDYCGSTFTGIVSDTTDNQIILSPIKGKRQDTFIGIINSGCAVPVSQGGTRPMLPPDIPKGTELTVLYVTKSKSDAGNKVDENIVIAITMLRWHDQAIQESHQKLFQCTDEKFRFFKAFR